MKWKMQESCAEKATVRGTSLFIYHFKDQQKKVSQQYSFAIQQNAEEKMPIS